MESTALGRSRGSAWSRAAPLRRTVVHERSASSIIEQPIVRPALPRRDTWDYPRFRGSLLPREETGTSGDLDRPLCSDGSLVSFPCVRNHASGVLEDKLSSARQLAHRGDCSEGGARRPRPEIPSFQVVRRPRASQEAFRLAPSSGAAATACVRAPRGLSGLARATQGPDRSSLDASEGNSPPVLSGPDREQWPGPALRRPG